MATENANTSDLQLTQETLEDCWQVLDGEGRGMLMALGYLLEQRQRTGTVSDADILTIESEFPGAVEKLASSWSELKAKLFQGASCQS
jgi:hypothetical protein